MVGRAAGKIGDFKGPKTPFSLIFKLVSFGFRQLWARTQNQKWTQLRTGSLRYGQQIVIPLDAAAKVAAEVMLSTVAVV